MNKLGIGILSFAHGHVNAYAQQIKTFDDAQLIACWDDDESTRAAAGRDFWHPLFLAGGGRPLAARHRLRHRRQ
jgi:hypothetical protein